MAILCFAVACGVVEEHGLGWNERSHFAQVRAFDKGTPRIGPYQRSTGDKAYYRGHYYSDKAPGLALATLPVFHLGVRAGLIRPLGTGKAISSVHLLVIFGCVIPAAILLLLICWLVERHEPGRGGLVAITLGIGTLLLPYATIFFSHELSTFLGFAAFCLLWSERDRGRGLGRVAAAGALVGFAVATEYPLGLLAVLLGVYVACRRHPIRPVLAYGLGMAVGLIPLALYDWWAFGSPLHLSYSYVPANSSGVLGLGAPTLHGLVELLVADRGLLVRTPIVAAGLAGLVILYREGRRGDALTAGGVVAAYLIYNACYYLPFGGTVPGPRFLITMLPFLALPLAAAYRKAPLATAALALISAATMMLATVTGPELRVYASSADFWLSRLSHGDFVTPTWTVWVFGGLILVAILLAARSLPRPRVTRLDLELTVVALGGWMAVRRAGPVLLTSGFLHHPKWSLIALLALVALLVALAAVVVRLAAGDKFAVLAAIPAVALAVRPADTSTLVLCLVAACIALLALTPRAVRLAP